jgi:hypothetical protein
MANRFTATEKWNDPWFCSLNEKDKLFWIYLVDNCDHAGIWQVNWPLVSFHIKDYAFNKNAFKERVVELREDKWFIPKFVEFQYKTGLNPENRAHQSVLSILKKEGACKGLIRGIKGRKDTEQDKDKDMDKEERGEVKERGVPPSRDSIVKYFLDLKSTNDEADKFFDHFESNGWRIAGKTPMKNWQAAVRNWIRRIDKPQEGFHKP